LRKLYRGSDVDSEGDTLSFGRRGLRLRGEGVDGGGHEGSLDGPGEAFGEKSGSGEDGGSERGDEWRRNIGSAIDIDSCCDCDGLSICDCNGENPNCEYVNISGAGTCDSVSICDSGIELISISVAGHWRDPLGVTSGVSMYGSDSCENTNCGND
jgi:hypothetical protein